MNWMIDGAYGDLYRGAMGYEQLKPHNELEPAMNGSATRSVKRAARALLAKGVSAYRAFAVLVQPGTESVPQDSTVGRH